MVAALQALSAPKLLIYFLFHQLDVHVQLIAIFDFSTVKILI
jgi:hypothetical protein